MRRLTERQRCEGGRSERTDLIRAREIQGRDVLRACYGGRIEPDTEAFDVID